MKLDELLNHLDRKKLLKPTKGDPTMPPTLNLPKVPQSGLFASKIDFDEIMKPHYSEQTQEGDWLEQCEIKPPNPDHLPYPDEEERIADSLGGKSLDSLGWYCPFHYYEEDYGIYIKSEVIKKNTRALINLMTPSERHEYHNLSFFDKCVFSQEIKRAAFLSIFNHEVYHHSVESFATRLEMVNEHPYFIDYHEKIYRHYQNPLHDDLIEEALATAYPLKYFQQNAGKLFTKFPNDLRIGNILSRFEFIKILHCKTPGYRGANNLVKERRTHVKSKDIGVRTVFFDVMERELQQTILDCKYYPSGDIENWRYAPLMMRPYFKRDVPVYEVFDPKTSSTVLPWSTHYLQLSPQKALKIARKKWNIINDGQSSGDHIKVKLPVSKKRIDFDTGYNDIPRKEWEILIEGMNEVLSSNYKPNEEGRRKFIKGP